MFLKIVLSINLFFVFFNFCLLAQSPSFLKIHYDNIKDKNVNTVKVFGYTDKCENKFLAYEYEFEKGNLVKEIEHLIFADFTNCTTHRKEFRTKRESKYDDHDEVIYSLFSEGEKRIEQYISLEYDDNGNKISKTMKQIGREEEAYEYYKYDESHNLVGINTYNVFTRAPLHISFQMNKDGNVERINYPNFYFQYKYLPNGEILKLQIEEHSGNLFSEKKYSADKKELYEKSYVDNNIIVYRYNEQGLLVEEENMVLIDKEKYEGNRVYLTNFYYNEKGLIEKEVMEKDGDVYCYEYKYTSNNTQ